MKINGPNHVNVNPYKQQFAKQADIKKAEKRSDEIEISKEAFKLQEKGKPSDARMEKLMKIQQQLADGQYKIDYEKTAEKMIEFWKR